MAIEPNRPQTIGQVLDTGLELFKQVLQRLWWLYIPVAVLSVVPMAYTLVNATSKTIDGLAAAQGVTYWLLTVALYVVHLWFYGTTTFFAAALARDEHIELKSAMLQSLRKLPAQFTILICVMVIILLGAMLLLVPAVIFSVSLMLALLVSLIEGLGPFAAIGRSHRLIWGMWWRSFAILSIASFIYMVLYLAVGALLGGVLAAMRSPDLIYNIMLAGTAVSCVLHLITIPFFTTSLLAIYWDTRLRKEGVDIAERIEALPATATATATV